MNECYLLFLFFDALLSLSFLLTTLLPSDTASIALVGTIPAGVLRFTPTLLHLCTVLLRNLHSPWNEDVVPALVITALTNLSGPSAEGIHKRSPITLIAGHALDGEQSVLVDAQTSLAILVVASGDS